MIEEKASIIVELGLNSYIVKEIKYNESEYAIWVFVITQSQGIYKNQMGCEADEAAPTYADGLF